MSDHYNHVIKRSVKKAATMETAEEQQEDRHYAKNNTTADKIRAACDRRLSRAAREIIRQKLVQALVVVVVVDETKAPAVSQPTKANKILATSSSSSKTARESSPASGGRRNNSIITLQDILASNDPDKFSVWELLESVTTAAKAANSNNSTNDDPSSSSSSSCLLQAQRDVLRHDEEHISIIKADLQGYRSVDTPTANRRHVNQFKSHWYQCMLCGKVFSSRFYLDRHLQQTHHHPLETELQSSEQEDNSNSHHHDIDDDNDGTSFWICPATDWCGNFLSLSACHEMALLLEPHYGPGNSHGGGRRRNRGVGVENRLWKEAHEQPCTTSGMQAATVSCRSMIQSCFFPQQQQPATAAALFLLARQRHVGQALDKSLCSTLSCPDRLHRVFFQTKTGGDLVMRHVHEWQDEWLYWNEDHHAIGWLGVILLLLLAAWYANALLLQHLSLRLPRATVSLVPSYFRQGVNKRRKVPNAQGSRLLRKSPTKATTVRGTKTKES